MADKFAAVPTTLAIVVVPVLVALNAVCASVVLRPAVPVTTMLVALFRPPAANAVSTSLML